MSQKITPCLWTDDRIEDAANYYAAVFRGKVLNVAHYPDGRALTAHVDMLGTTFMLLNGGPQFKYTEAVSFSINCKDQAEVDYYWNHFVGDGGEESMCGWCKDKFGLSWQVVPAAMERTIGGPDKAGSARAMQAMMKMKKLVVTDLEKAYAGK
jgi:predicted 3-demethylubiquinone-9 3-methyltransferase (glyoxalase superfamily)